MDELKDEKLYISDPENENEPDQIEYKKEKCKNNELKRKRKNICPGCEPIFQLNQLAHIGPNGCLGEY